MVEQVDTRDLKDWEAAFTRIQQKRQLRNRLAFLFVFSFTRFFSAIAATTPFLQELRDILQRICNTGGIHAVSCV